jgi:hypothetical protein
MKVFLSWSGEPSRSIAHALREWLPTVAQHVDPWMSDEEIKSGTRWNDKVAEALDGTDFGIVCVTASNQHKPWLMFEAGALAKRLAVAQLVPLCVDLAPSEITGPMETFQARRLDEHGMRKVVHDLMALRDKPPALAQSDEIFQALWPSLEAKVNEAKQQSPDPQVPQRGPQEILEELVDRVRRIERELAGAASAGHYVADRALLTYLLESSARQAGGEQTPTTEPWRRLNNLLAREMVTRRLKVEDPKPDDDGPPPASLGNK